MALTEKLTAIADAIRDKTGDTAALTLDQMPVEIESIQTGVPINNQDKTITKNGTYTADEGYTGLGTVNVNVARDDQTDVAEQFIRFIERDTSKPITEIPAGVTKIGAYAFYYNKNIESISLPSGLTSIGNDAFSRCTNLAITSLPSSVTSIGSSAFYDCTNLALTSLPPGLTNIESGTFKYCENLALTSLPPGVTSIGSSAFYNCEKMPLTSLPDGLTTIGASAFYQCFKLAVTSFPSGLTSIDSNGFIGCYALTEITFNSTPSIASNAFQYCSNIHTINVPWAEGEVKNAPWGATNATINYNYTGG